MVNELPRVLVVEDMPTDAELCEREVEKILGSCEFRRVETREEFITALDAFRPALIISDFKLPHFDALAALKLARVVAPDIPFIILTGAMNEDTAVECMKAGASDYVIKEHIKRLRPAISNALEQKRLRQARASADGALRDSEAALRESEEKYRTLFDNAGDAIFIHDSQGQILAVNTAACERYGYSQSELLSMTLAMVDAPEQSVQARERTALLMDLGSLQFETEHRHKNGRSIAVEVNARKINWSGCPVAMSICRDVTERKRAEAEHERLTTAIEQAGEMIYITAPDGTIQYVNPAFESVTGYTRQEAMGQNPRFLKSGKQDIASYRELWQTITGSHPWRGRMINKRKDGTFFTEDATISPVCDAAGRIVNFVAVKRDVTEHLRLEEQLQGAQRIEAIGSLAGGVAHDFNNLLTVILSYTSFTIEQMREGDPLRDQLEQVKRAGERAAALTRQLLAFSRKQVLEPQVLDLNYLIVNLDKMLRRLIGENITCAHVLAPDLGRLRADPGQIEQVIMNLVVNARDAMPDGGKLTIETANVDLDDEYAARHVAVTPGPYVMLVISDTGCGMDTATQRRLFEPFFTTKAKGKGTGLGLSTVYGIVKQSCGNIWAYSEVGQGSTFKVYLPRLVGDTKPDALKRTGERPAVGTETILLVEDDESVRRVAVRMLRASGYRVLTAANGGEALIACEQNPGQIHLLLTDVVMPQMSGRQLAERLQRLRPSLRVLYMSGYTNDAIVHHGVLDPGTKFISKPFSAAGLARKVRDVLDSDLATEA